MPTRDSGSGEDMSGRKGFAILITIAIVFITCVWGIVTCSNNQPGPADCYTTDFRNTYTWTSARPELDAMWADHVLTVGECNRIPQLNQEAQVADARAELMEDMRGK